ncbi:MAG: hypothetical protein WAQ28_03510 [Bacteroidia bacterium]
MQSPIYNITWGAILGALITLLLLQQCSSKVTPCPEAKIDHDTLKTTEYDSIPKYIPVKEYLPADSVIVEIPRFIDTLAILDRFFKAYVYDRVFENDSVKISVYDTISQNKIVGSSDLKYQFLFPISHNTIEQITTIDTTKKPGNRLMFGISLGFSKERVQTIAAEAILTTKRSNYYKLGYNIFRNEVLIGFGYTPQFKRF